jgi:hypothetical protein
MARNSKSQRNTGSIPKAQSASRGIVTAPKSEARRIFGNFLQPSAFVTTSSKMALTAMKKVAGGEGNFHDWNVIMTRMYVGSFAYTHYFKKDEGIADAINWGVHTLQLVMARTLCIGADGFALRPSELDRVVDALAVIDTMTLYMQPDEVMYSYHNAGSYIEEFVAVNKKASDLFHERQAVLNTLAIEHQNANEVPELEEAA